MSSRCPCAALTACSPIVSAPIDTETPYQLLAGLLSSSCTQRFGIDSLSLTDEQQQQEAPIIPVVTMTTRYEGIHTVTYVTSIIGSGSAITVQLNSAGSTLYWQQLGEPGLLIPPPPVYTLAWALDGTRASGSSFQLMNFSLDGVPSVKSNQQVSLLPSDLPDLPLVDMRAYLLLNTYGASSGDWVRAQSIIFATPDALADALDTGLIVGRPVMVTWTLFTTFPIPTTSRIADACVQLCI